MSESVSLHVASGRFSVCRLAPDTVVAQGDGAFWSVTRTADEVSVVCEVGREPPEATVVGPWALISVSGPLDFSLVGILDSLLAPLAREGVSVFTVSTFDTDHVLVRDGDLERALSALRAAGHSVD